TPMWAGIAAIVGGLRGAGNALDGPNQFLPALYAIASDPASYKNDFLDVTTGSTGRSSLARAGTGYDLATGLGSANAANLVNSLVPVHGTGSSISFGAAANAVARSTATPHVVATLPAVFVPIPGTLTFIPPTSPSPTPSPNPIQTPSPT